jgi:hypothetical protein
MFVCQKRKCNREFEPLRNRKKQKFCPKCNSRTNRTTAEQYKFHRRSPESYLRWLHSKLPERVAGKKKKIKLDVTVAELLEIFHRQNGKCVLTRDIMTHDPGLASNMSIDRIDADGDYTKSNIRLVRQDLNIARGDSSVEEFERIILAAADAIRRRPQPNPGCSDSAQA